MKGKMLCGVAVLLFAPLQAQGTGTKRPSLVEKTPALQISKAEAQCTGADTSKCQAHELLTAAQIHLYGYKAEVSLDTLFFESEHKSRATVTKSAKEASASIAKNVLPLIDHALTFSLPTNVMDGIRNYRVLALFCSSQLDMGKSETADGYNDRVNGCLVPVQNQLDDVFVALGYPAQHPRVGFRKSAWGDSPENVVALEGKPSDKTPDGSLFVYRTTLSGHDAIAFFRFVEGKLVSGGYSFTDQHSNDNMFIDDYDAIADALKTKYGAPSSHGTNWEADLFKNDRSHWGTAVASGQMNMLEMWSLGDTDIMHALDGDNFKVKHLIRYTSIEYKPLINQAQKAKSTEGL
jgi:hypothetical protein